MILGLINGVSAFFSAFHDWTPFLNVSVSVNSGNNSQFKLESTCEFMINLLFRVLKTFLRRGQMKSFAWNIWDMAPSVFEVGAKGTAKFTSRCRTKISPGSNLMQGNKLSQWIVLNIFRRVRRKLHCLCCILDLFAFNRVLGTIRARVEVGNDRVDIFYRVANPNIWMYYLPDPSTNPVSFVSM